MLYVRYQDLLQVRQDLQRRDRYPVRDCGWYVNDLRRRRRPLPRGPGQREDQRPRYLPDVA